MPEGTSHGVKVVVRLKSLLTQYTHEDRRLQTYGIAYVLGVHHGGVVSEAEALEAIRAKDQAIFDLFTNWVACNVALSGIPFHPRYADSIRRRNENKGALEKRLTELIAK